MQAIQNWCYTIFAGVLFSGIVLLLTPSERFRPLMQLLLGAFLLVCIFTWCGRANIQLEMKKRSGIGRRSPAEQRTTL